MNRGGRFPRLRGLLLLLLAAMVVAGSLTALAPGFVRLAVLQPPRDLLFFQRELEPLQNFAEIERRRPRPDATETLPAGTTEDEVELVFDLWIPRQNPAPTVILLHGSSPRGRELGFNMLLAEQLREHGWLVLTPDVRGFGDSGIPADPADPAAWSVATDLARLVAYARRHPGSNGVVVGVGHSSGGSHLLQLDSLAAEFSAFVLIGPSRDQAGDERAWWRRVRFSSDRRMAQAIPEEVAETIGEWHDLLRFAANRPEAFQGRPMLLMDGEREGEELIAVLRDAAARMQPESVHVTVPDVHHYCGAYQLPWPAEAVYVRPALFERCFAPLARFLSRATGRTR